MEGIKNFDTRILDPRNVYYTIPSEYLNYVVLLPKSLRARVHTSNAYKGPRTNDRYNYQVILDGTEVTGDEAELGVGFCLDADVSSTWRLKLNRVRGAWQLVMAKVVFVT
jgi:hypothetical protein